jgi:hypothetical protein
MVFTIHRGEKFVAAAVAQTVGCDATVLAVSAKDSEPVEGDQVSNHRLLSSIKPPLRR